MYTRIWNFISFWYFRYTIVTDLYLLETWENCVMNILFGSFLFVCSLFNYAITLPFVSYAMYTLKYVWCSEAVKSIPALS